MAIKININGNDTYIEDVKVFNRDDLTINRVVVNNNGNETTVWERY